MKMRLHSKGRKLST